MSSGQYQKQAVSVQIRWMIRRDMPEVLKIEHESFEFNWTEEDFLACLRQRNCIGMVAEHDNRVVGFMIYELHKTRLHILNFAVASRVPPAGGRSPDDRKADQQALAAAPPGNRAGSPRNQPGRPVVLSVTRVSGRYAFCAATTPTRPKTPT